MSGVKFNLENDEEILEINSPRASVEGPYVVVYKNISERWAIVALCWDECPTLGIRWFHRTKGSPNSRGIATWFIIPLGLQDSILNSLPLKFQFRDNLNQFLAGEIVGEQLKKGVNL